VARVQAGVEDAHRHALFAGLLTARLVGPHHVQAPELVVERVQARGRLPLALALASGAGEAVLLLDRVDLRGVRRVTDRAALGRADKCDVGGGAAGEVGTGGRHLKHPDAVVARHDRAAGGGDRGDSRLGRDAVLGDHRVLGGRRRCRVRRSGRDDRHEGQRRRCSDRASHKPSTHHLFLSLRFPVRIQAESCFDLIKAGQLDRNHQPMSSPVMSRTPRSNGA
jgi:hypothetical protein